MMRRLVLVVGFVGILLAVGEDGYGQGFQGGVSGAVRDSGGAVPGAAVSLTNEDTGLSRSALTNTLGEYAFASVEAGTYKIKIALQGYKTIERVRRSHRHAELPRARPEPRGRARSKSPSRSPCRLPSSRRRTRRTATVLDRVAARNPAFPGRAAFLMAALDCRRSSLGRRPVQPAAGSDQRLARCRSAAARAAATTTRSTASRSPTSSTVRSPTRRWSRSRT